MSSLLLNFPKKPHQLSDDLESFVHILIWLTIRFQTHWPGTVELWCVVLAYEDATRTSDGFDVGSSAKLDNMRRGEPGFNLEHIHVPPLAKLIENLVQMCKQHHASLDWEKDLKPYTSVDTAKAFEMVYEWSAKNKRADMGDAEADLDAGDEVLVFTGSGEGTEGEREGGGAAAGDSKAYHGRLRGDPRPV